MFKTILLLFICFSTHLSGQKKKDSTYVEPYADCTEYYKKDSILLQKLTIEKSVINYSSLNKQIFNKILNLHLKSENLIVFVENGLKRYAIVPDDFYYCFSKINVKNPNYNETDFWTSEYLQKLNKSEKNVIPKTFEIFQNKQYFVNKNSKLKNSKLYNFIISTNNVANFNSEEVYYLAYKKTNLTQLNEYDSIRLEFTNYLQKIVEVKFFYKSATDNYIMEKIYTFKFINNKWKLIKEK